MRAVNKRSIICNRCKLPMTICTGVMVTHFGKDYKKSDGYLLYECKCGWTKYLRRKGTIQSAAI